jgi:hypothetical protein
MATIKTRITFIGHYEIIGSSDEYGQPYRLLYVQREEWWLRNSQGKCLGVYRTRRDALAAYSARFASGE